MGNPKEGKKTKRKGRKTTEKTIREKGPILTEKIPLGTVEGGKRGETKGKRGETLGESWGGGRSEKLVGLQLEGEEMGERGGFRRVKCGLKGPKKKRIEMEWERSSLVRRGSTTLSVKWE